VPVEAISTLFVRGKRRDGARQEEAAAAPAAVSPSPVKPRKAGKPAAPAKPSVPAKPQEATKAAKAAKPTKPAKPAKPAKPDPLVRDSFTMPAADFALIATLKGRALSVQQVAKKSELLRAGLQALAALDAPALVAALQRLEPVKVGRPKKSR
jgi:hypothetical protein